MKFSRLVSPFGVVWCAVVAALAATFLLQPAHALTDFSHLNSLHASSASSTANKASAAAAKTPSATIAGIDVAVFDEINRRAVERALRLVDFDAGAIARASFIETGSGAEVRADEVRQAGLRSVTEGLRGGRGRGQVVYSLSDEPETFDQLQQDLEITAFLQEAMALNAQAEDNFFPSMRDLANMLGFDEENPAADAAGTGAEPNAYETQRPPAPPAPEQISPSFLEASARARAESEAFATSTAGAGAAAGATAGTSAAAAARASARANMRTDPAAGTAADSSVPGAENGGASGNEQPTSTSTGYTAPHAPPSFSEWLKTGAQGSGQTGLNMGIDYKPDPRRHPPPPPVPTPPPPPPPPSFTASSPMAAFR